MKTFVPIDKNIIIEYIKNDITALDICKKYKVGKKRFLKSIYFYNMVPKSKDNINKIRVKNMLNVTHSKLYDNKEEIVELYTSGKENSITLAKKFNCSTDKILLFLRNNNIEILTRNEKQLINKNNFIKNNMEEVKKLYCEYRLTCEQIGKLYNMHRETIRKFLLEYGGETRDSPKFDGSTLLGASYVLKYGTEEEKQKIKKNMRKWSEDDIDEKIKYLNISRISRINNNSVTLKCNTDNHIWNYTPTKIMNGYGCPLCKNKTEKYINFLLLTEIGDNSNICILHNRFFCKYNFDNRKRKALVDFIVKYNNKVVAIIEYNGIQHYQSFKFGNMTNSIAEENFVRQKIRDVEVEKHCINKNILFFSIDGRLYTLYKNNMSTIIKDIIQIIRKSICAE